MLLDAKYNAGKGMDDPTKIQHFKTGIKADAGLELALSTLRSNPTKYSTFSAVTTYVASEVKFKKIRRSQLNASNPCRVSGLGKEEKGKDKSQVVDGKRVYSKIYPPDERAKLTRSQRKTVLILKTTI